MPYCITLRSRTNARITGWYDGSASRWSTDHKRHKLFDKIYDAKPVCDDLRRRCPRNAKVINIEAAQSDPSGDVALEKPGDQQRKRDRERIERAVPEARLWRARREGDLPSR
jgi:hypothetical protein